MPSSAPVQPLSPKKQTPTFLQLAKPPRVVHLGEVKPVSTLSDTGQVQVTVFDFGAASLAYQWPLPEGLPLENLKKLSRTLYDLNLEPRARKRILEFMEEIRPAITRPELSALVEDYYLFVIENFDRPHTAAGLLSDEGASIAQVLRFETDPLSRQQQDEALNHRLSYYENDLVRLERSPHLRP